MKLNPLSRWMGRRKAAETNTSSALAAAQREHAALGAWSGTFAGFVPRQVNPALYEAMREALPMVDGAIGMMVTLDGIVRVEGGNAALVAEIDAWMQTVQVNDAEIGLQAFYESMGNEIYEQGFAIGEWTAVKGGAGIARMRVADSKGVMFLRDGDALRTFYRACPAKPARSDGLDAAENLLRRTPGLTAASLVANDFKEVDLRRVVYAVNRPEADNPYGTSLLRGLEVTADTTLRIQTALGRTWTRWGDPSHHVAYKTKNGRVTGDELDKRKRLLAEELAAVLAGKERGNSADLVTATGMMDEITVNALGASTVVLDPDKPLKHVTEQVCARFGMPPWLLGVDGTVGAGQAERQSELVLQAAKTRWERRKPGLEALVANHLRLTGRTWKAGDWKLVQELPNLQDMMKIAQANFLNAQASMVAGGDGGRSPQGVDNNLRAARAPRAKRANSATKATGDGEEDPAGEGWAGADGPAMRRIERRGIQTALASWWDFAAAVGAVLGFDVARRVISPSGQPTTPWVFPHERLPELLVLEQRFLQGATSVDGPVLAAVFSAWTQGATTAVAETGAALDIAAFRERIAMQLQTRGGELVRNATVRAWRERIFGQLAGGALDGTPVQAVADLLQQKFEAGEYDWQRLVTSEMNIARSRAKLDGYRAAGLQRYDYITMDDDRVSQICRTLEANGPYDIDDPAAPVPVDSSHPNCRCTVLSRAADA